MTDCRRCEICGCELPAGSRKNRRFCSTKCYRKSETSRIAKYRKPIDHTPIVCPVCDGQFLPITRKHKYCSPACRAVGLSAARYPNPTIRVDCEHCGETFNAPERGRGGRQRFCGVNCRSAYHRAAKGGKVLSPRTCEVCLKEYRPSWNKQRSCDRNCGKFLEMAHGRIADRCDLVFEMPVPWGACCSCGQVMIRRMGRSLCPTCSEDRSDPEQNRIRARDDYRRKFGLVPQSETTCAECGAVFTPSKWKRPDEPGQRTCSDACGAKEAHRHRRHIERLAVRAGERFTLREIAERDGWRCHICGKRVPTVHHDGRTYNPKAGTLDHLIPISHGGPHTRANVALAHHQCNSERSDGRIAAQLMLIG